jgi:hypothetical protein
LSDASVSIRDLWQAITPMARWEWVRWVNATRNADTRKRRVEVSISKLSKGKRRPCCFDLAACTDPELSKGGKLVLDQGLVASGPEGSAAPFGSSGLSNDAQESGPSRRLGRRWTTRSRSS